MTIAVTAGLAVTGFSAAGNAFLGAVYGAVGQGRPEGVVHALSAEPLSPERVEVLRPLARAMLFFNPINGRFFEGQLRKASDPRRAETAAGHIIGLFDDLPRDSLLAGARILRGVFTEARLQHSFAEFNPSLMAAVLAVLGPEKVQGKTNSLPTRDEIMKRIEEFETAMGGSAVSEEILWGVLDRALQEADIKKLKTISAVLLFGGGDSRSVASRLLLYDSPLARRWACESLIGLSDNPNNVLSVLYRNQKLLIQKELKSEEESLRRETVFLIAAFAEWGVSDAKRWLKDLARLKNEIVSETAAFVLEEME